MVKIIQLFFLILYLFLNSAALAGGRTGSASSAARAVVVVDSLMNQGLLDEAIKKARTNLEVFEADLRWNPIFENRLAIALLRTGKPAEALPLLENWVRNHPNEAQGHQNLGACLVALGRKGRALSEYQLFVELDPGNAQAHLEYAQVLLEFRIFQDAGQEIFTAARLCGDCLEVQPILAQYYEAVNQPADAVAPWRMLWVETGNPVARRNLLKSLLNSGQDLDVLKLLLETSAMEMPKDELQQLVAAEGRLGLIEQSLQFAEILLENSGESGIPPSVVADPVFWGQISHNLFLSGHHQASLAAIDRAVLLSPQNVVFLNNRVVLLQKLGRHEEALKAWDEVLVLDPSLERK